jgi:GMP synthase (glutamine-hydrolysing)
VNALWTRTPNASEEAGIDGGQDRKPDADGRRFVLMELECLEPALFLGANPAPPRGRDHRRPPPRATGGAISATVPIPMTDRTTDLPRPGTAGPSSLAPDSFALPTGQRRAAHPSTYPPAGGPEHDGAVLILQHVAYEGPGRIADALVAAGVPFRVVHAGDGEPVPRDAENTAGVVVMGGPMGVGDRDTRPHLRAELRLIEDALRRGVPTLGICLGSQLLASVLGAAVRRGPRKEIGWFPVQWMAGALDDPLAGPVAAEPLTAFHWHGDVFDLPASATPLARSAMTAHQGYRWDGGGAAAYGLLFHLEVTPALVAGMTTAFREELAAEGLDGDRLTAGAHRHEAPLTRVARQLFGGWAALAAGRVHAVRPRAGDSHATNGA